MSYFLPFLFLFFVSFHVANGSVCSLKNSAIESSWQVIGDNQLQIHFEHNNFTTDRWTSIAFGNGPGMTNIEAIIFSRVNDVVTTSTGYTPKKKKVVIDSVPYVTVKSVNLNGNLLKITVTRPLGPAGPRDYSLDKCVNWLILSGGSMKEGHLKKHHGGIATAKNVCANECKAPSKLQMLRSNRVH